MKVMMIAASVAGLLLTGVPVCGQVDPKPVPQPAAPPAIFDARFADGSTMKLVLRDERLLLDSRFGQLSVRVGDIRRIDFALRIALETRQRIERAIAALSSESAKVREPAMFELFALKEQAYPFLVQTARGKDELAAVSAIRIIQKLRETMPLEQLEVPEFDIIYTDDARLPGRFVGEFLRVTTSVFGDQDVKLAGLKSLNSASAEVQQPTSILPDPGTLSSFPATAGQSAIFRVLAPPLGSIGERGVYGSGIYAVDSSLARAAIHAGVLQPGQTGLVRVTFVGSQPAYQSSSRFGIVSSAYGPWPGFRIEAVRGN